MYRLIISVALVCYAVAAEARVGMEKQDRYEGNALMAGACQDTDHLKFLEGVYNVCEATEAQWESMYEKFKEGQEEFQQGRVDPATCGVVRDVLANGRELQSTFGGNVCQ